jgi:hypothetical protein
LSERSKQARGKKQTSIHFLVTKRTRKNKHIFSPLMKITVQASTLLTSLVLSKVSSFAPPSSIGGGDTRRIRPNLISPPLTASPPYRQWTSSSSSLRSKQGPVQISKQARTCRNQSSLNDQCLLTPEGYGFSSTAERIIQQAKRGESMGYVAVKGDDRVIDVMADITEGEEDVALAYDGSTLLGIFTETDYINVSSSSTAVV